MVDNSNLTEAEKNLLTALWKKGPALPIELAVRTFSLPEEISASLESPEQKGLVERQSIKSGEIVVLSKSGQEMVRG